MSLSDIVDAGCRAGVHVTNARVVLAMHRGEIEAVRPYPARFTQAEANRWLSDLVQREWRPAT